MGDELKCARKTAVTALRELSSIRPWAFEFTPASSEPPTDAYLRKVEEADFVIWLIGAKTTPPVVSEINACIAAGRRLLAFKFPTAHRDETTRELIDNVSTYAKWQSVQDVTHFASHLKAAVSDEFIRGLRNPVSPARKHRLTELRRLSLANCKQMWTTLGVPEEVAAELASDESLGDVLQSPDPGVTLIIGDVGTGKTLAASRLYQHAASRALQDSSQPFPLFVNARDLREPLSDYIHRMSHGFCQPSIQPVFFVIDGLDEIGVTRANDLIAQVQAYADAANAKLTGVVTSRKLPGLKDVRRSIKMPAHDDDSAIHLMSRIAGRQVTLPECHAWSESVRDAARHPLFAVMIGTELRRTANLHLLRRNQLVSSLAEDALPPSRDDAATVDRLLQLLAVKTISAGRRVPKSAVSVRRFDQVLMTDSRLVDEHDGFVDFTLSIFREWYAARAIMERTVLLDDISRFSDRWIIPLAIAISSEDSEVQHALMRKLAWSDPGLASSVMAETDDNWQRDDDAGVFPESEMETARLVKDAMDAWKQGFGKLFPVTGPVTQNSRARNVVVRIVRERHIATTSWRNGAVNRGSSWHTLTLTEKFPFPKSWPWSMTKKLLVESLSDALKLKWFASESDDAARELAWVLALAVKRQGSLDATPISLREVLNRVVVLNRYIDDPMARWMSVSVGTAEFSNLEVALVERHLRTLLDGGARLIEDPWPSADRFPGSGGWVWNLYSGERLLDRTVAVYSAALRIYRAMVDKWFGAFSGRLQLYRLMPVRLEGRLVLSGEGGATDRGPGLDIRSRSLPFGEKSEVAFDLGPEEAFDVFSYWKEEQSNLCQVRPESATTLVPIVGSYALDVFHGRPATALAHRWLAGELHEMGWSSRWHVEP